MDIHLMSVYIIVYYIITFLKQNINTKFEFLKVYPQIIFLLSGKNCDEQEETFAFLPQGIGRNSASPANNLPFEWEIHSTAKIDADTCGASGFWLCQKL